MHTVPHRLAALNQQQDYYYTPQLKYSMCKKKNANHPDFNDQGIVTVNCLFKVHTVIRIPYILVEKLKKWITSSILPFSFFFIP